MCNPRKIVERATRTISEAWREVIQRTAQLGGTVSGRAELVQPIGSMLSDPARRAFEQAVVADPRWELRDGAYCLPVTGGTARYRQDTRELEVSVELSAYVQVEGSASRAFEGVVESTVEASAEGSFYDDGYRGLTEERARREARRLADQEAERRQEEEARTAREEGQRRAGAAAAAGDADVRREAERDARRRLAAEQERQRSQLSRQAEEQLDHIHQESMRGVWETVAIGYQNALVEYARRNGAQSIDVSHAGSTVQIQFQMEA